MKGIKNKHKDYDWLREQIENTTRSISDIADECGVSRRTIRNFCDKFRINRKNRKRSHVAEEKDYVCPVCDTKFKKRVYKKSQTIYCCQECAYKGRTLGYTKRVVENGYDTSPTIVKLNCKKCSKEFEVEMFKRFKVKFCSKECRLKSFKEKMLGDKNHSWIDGRSYDKRGYRGDDWGKIRVEIYKRDGYICQDCGVKCISRREANKNNSRKIIQCHHIVKYDKEKDNNNEENLITLCLICHVKIHNMK